MSRNQLGRLLTAKEVGLYLGISERRVRQLAQDGELPFHRVGRWVRFHPTDLEQFLTRTRVQMR